MILYLCVIEAVYAKCWQHVDIVNTDEKNPPINLNQMQLQLKKQWGIIANTYKKNQQELWQYKWQNPKPV